MIIDLVPRTANAFVQAMLTDSWQGVRHKVAELFGRGQPDPVIEQRLDATRDQLTAAAPTDLASVQAAMADEWRARLSDLVADQPDVAGELAALFKQLGQVSRAEATSSLTASD